MRAGLVKHPWRAAEKAVGCYGGDAARVIDICRARIWFGEPAEPAATQWRDAGGVEPAAAAAAGDGGMAGLRRGLEAVAADAGVEVVRVKDWLGAGGVGGFRDPARQVRYRRLRFSVGAGFRLPSSLAPGNPSTAPLSPMISTSITRGNDLEVIAAAAADAAVVNDLRYSPSVRSGATVDGLGLGMAAEWVMGGWGEGAGRVVEYSEEDQVGLETRMPSDASRPTAIDGERRVRSGDSASAVLCWIQRFPTPGDIPSRTEAVEAFPSAAFAADTVDRPALVEQDAAAREVSAAVSEVRVVESAGDGGTPWWWWVPPAEVSVENVQHCPSVGAVISRGDRAVAGEVFCAGGKESSGSGNIGGGEDGLERASEVENDEEERAVLVEIYRRCARCSGSMLSGASSFRDALLSSSSVLFTSKPVAVAATRPFFQMLALVLAGYYLYGSFPPINALLGAEHFFPTPRRLRMTVLGLRDPTLPLSRANPLRLGALSVGCPISNSNGCSMPGTESGWCTATTALGNGTTAAVLAWPSSQVVDGYFFEVRSGLPASDPACWLVEVSDTSDSNEAVAVVDNKKSVWRTVGASVTVRRGAVLAYYPQLAHLNPAEVGPPGSSDTRRVVVDMRPSWVDWVMQVVRGRLLLVLGWLLAAVAGIMRRPTRAFTTLTCMYATNMLLSVVSAFGFYYRGELLASAAAWLYAVPDLIMAVTLIWVEKKVVSGFGALGVCLLITMISNTVGFYGDVRAFLSDLPSSSAVISMSFAIISLTIRHLALYRARRILRPDQKRYDLAWTAVLSEPTHRQSLEHLALLACRLRGGESGAGPAYQVNRLRQWPNKSSMEGQTVSPPDCSPFLKKTGWQYFRLLTCVRGEHSTESRFSDKEVTAESRKESNEYSQTSFLGMDPLNNKVDGLHDALVCGLPWTLDIGNPVDSLDQLYCQAMALHPLLIRKVVEWAHASGGCFRALPTAEEHRSSVAPTSDAGSTLADLESGFRPLENVFSHTPRLGGDRQQRHGAQLVERAADLFMRAASDSTVPRTPRSWNLPDLPVHLAVNPTRTRRHSGLGSVSETFETTSERPAFGHHSERFQRVSSCSDLDPSRVHRTMASTFAFPSPNNVILPRTGDLAPLKSDPEAEQEISRRAASAPVRPCRESGALEGITNAGNVGRQGMRCGRFTVVGEPAASIWSAPCRLFRRVWMRTAAEIDHNLPRLDECAWDDDVNQSIDAIAEGDGNFDPGPPPEGFVRLGRARGVDGYGWEDGWEAVERVQWASIKSVGRAMEKVIRSYSEDVARLVDLCRQTIYFETADGLRRCFAAMARDPEAALVRVKNRLDPQADATVSGGYRNVAVNLRLATPEAAARGAESHVCEVQLLLLAMAHIKNDAGHAKYIAFRNLRGE